MKKVAVVYWSSSGNTEAMADAVLEGAKAAGAEAEIFSTEKFNASMVKNYDSLAFGCPAMGDEVLEETEFEPMFEDCISALRGKSVALFGSYGWGDGEWMRSWEAHCRDEGISLVCDSVICQETPDDSGKEECAALGKALA